MRKLNKISVLPILTGVLFLLASCLKDEPIENQEYGMINEDANKIVELASGDSHTKEIALPFKNVDTAIVAVSVRLAANDPATEDITVQLTMDNNKQIIDRYNAAKGKNVVPFPTSMYSLIGSGLTVTIPKGSRSADLKLAVNPSKFNPSATYGLGFNIKTVDKSGYVISGNFDTLLVTVAAKNEYDGVFTLRTKMTASDRPTYNTSTEWEWPGNVHLITSGANSVQLFDDYGFGTVIQPLQLASGGLSGFGQTAPEFTIDPVTYKVIAVTNAAPPGSLGRTFVIDPTGPNYYDPVTGNLYVSFIMNQTGFGPLYIKDTFLYVSERP